MMFGQYFANDKIVVHRLYLIIPLELFNRFCISIYIEFYIEMNITYHGMGLFFNYNGTWKLV